MNVMQKIKAKAAEKQFGVLKGMLERKYGKEIADFAVYAAIKEGLRKSGANVEKSKRKEIISAMSAALKIDEAKCEKLASDAKTREHVASALEKDGLKKEFVEAILNSGD